MEKADARRKQIIDIVAALPEGDSKGIVEILFEPLRIELTFLVSEEGFRSIFDRSVYLTSHKYVWLATHQPLQETSPLTELETRLSQHDFTEVRAASTALLLNFSDLMASLIGEVLTIDILRSAWGKDALDSLGEEFQQ